MRGIGFLMLMVVSALLGGLMLTIEWAWFIEPLGAQPLSVPHAIGLTALAAGMVRGLKREKEVVVVTLDDALAAILMAQVEGWAAVLIVSYPAHLWMVS